VTKSKAFDASSRQIVIDMGAMILIPASNVLHRTCTERSGYGTFEAKLKVRS